MCRPATGKRDGKKCSCASRPWCCWRRWRRALLAKRAFSTTAAFLQAAAPEEPAETAYVLNTATKKFHRMSCLSAAQMDEDKREIFVGTRDQVLAKGYSPCQWCDETE